jgi:hypothetical protein
MAKAVDKPEALYVLIMSLEPMVAVDSNENCEVYWGTKQEMQEKYDLAVADDENPYPNIILSRMVCEAQLAYEQIDYGDEE